MNISRKNSQPRPPFARVLAPVPLWAKGRAFLPNGIQESKGKLMQKHRREVAEDSERLVPGSQVSLNNSEDIAWKRRRFFY